MATRLWMEADISLTVPSRGIWKCNLVKNTQVGCQRSTDEGFARSLSGSAAKRTKKQPGLSAAQLLRRGLNEGETRRPEGTGGELAGSGGRSSGRGRGENGLGFLRPRCAAGPRRTRALRAQEIGSQAGEGEMPGGGGRGGGEGAWRAPGHDQAPRSIYICGRSTGAAPPAPFSPELGCDAEGP